MVNEMQALYAFFQTEDNDLPAAEKLLIRNIDRIYELYIWQLSFLVELFDYFIQRADEAKQKFLPSEDDLHPSTRFIDNKLINQLEANRDFLKQRDRYRINWSDEREMFRMLYNEIRNCNDYLNYMQVEKNTYDDDRNIIIKLIRNQFFPSAFLQGFFEEQYIHLVDDFDTDVEKLMRKGLKVISSAKYAGGGGSAYFETREIGNVILALEQLPPEY